MKDVIKELVGWIVSILLIVAVSYLIVTFVGQRTQVSGSSMETTLSDGDHLIVDKISYRFRDFVMGDNRNNSQDSRVSDVGAIHRDELMGRAWIRIWPLDQFGVIKHE